ncbi:MAG: hypothetical protein DRI52_08145 [Chloroflexi bacterium]|nr:MAG: hypothetical protein DRI52_08145 [Chloroflexota bacterium]
MRLRVEGADSVTLTPSPAPGEGRGGGLRLTTAVGEFTLPLLTVEGIVPDGQPATFNLEPGTFDVTSPFSLSPPLPLSVSPQDNPDDLLYSTFLGGSDDDGGRDIAVDASGAAYVTGSTASSDFPTTPGAFDTLYSGGDGFVVKVNADGTGLAYATFLSSGGSIAVDGAGSAYITGMTGSSDFPTTAGAFDRTYNGGYCDAFVVKLNADGTALTYATFLGGSDWDWGHAIAVDGSGAAYITGWTNSSNFPTTSGAFDRTHNGAGDIFVAKLNATGSALDYATFVGGDAGDRGLAIAVDESGAAYVTGEAGWGWPHEFPTTPGAFDRSHDGYDDAFVVKLNPAGSALVYATFLGGSNDER